MMRSIGTEKFTSQGYKDVIWAIIFLLQLGFVIITGFYSLGHISHKDSQPQPPNTRPSNSSIPYKYIFATVGTAVGLGFFASFLLLFFMKTFAYRFIMICNMTQIFMGLVASIAGFLGGSVATGIFMIFFAVINAFWLFLVRHRIHFASVILAAASEVIFSFVATVFVSFLCTGLSVAYFFLWLLTVALLWNVVPLRPFLIFFVFWTWQVFRNLGLVTVSGTVATWYFMYGTMPSNPTLGSLRRASSYSLGSICLGSLFVAVLQFLRFVANSTRGYGNDNNFIACCMNCLLSWLEQLLEYFNEYAFCHIAIYGHSYFEAARNAWRLITDCVLTMLINDSLSTTALTISCITFSLIVGLLAGLVPWDFRIHYIAYVVIGFTTSFFIMTTFTSAIVAAVKTLFVCYAEDDKPMDMRNGVLAQKLHLAAERIQRGESPFVVFGQPNAYGDGGMVTGQPIVEGRGNSPALNYL